MRIMLETLAAGALLLAVIATTIGAGLLVSGLFDNNGLSLASYLVTVVMNGCLWVGAIRLLAQRSKS